MGTRTWSRKGVLTAAGRRRQASLGVNADVFDIWGNVLDDDASTATTPTPAKSIVEVPPPPPVTVKPIATEVTATDDKVKKAQEDLQKAKDELKNYGKTMRQLKNADEALRQLLLLQQSIQSTTSSAQRRALGAKLKSELAKLGIKESELRQKRNESYDKANDFEDSKSAIEKKIKDAEYQLVVASSPIDFAMRPKTRGKAQPQGAMKIDMARMSPEEILSRVEAYAKNKTANQFYTALFESLRHPNAATQKTNIQSGVNKSLIQSVIDGMYGMFDANAMTNKGVMTVQSGISGITQGKANGGYQPSTHTVMLKAKTTEVLVHEVAHALQQQFNALNNVTEKWAMHRIKDEKPVQRIVVGDTSTVAPGGSLYRDHVDDPYTLHDYPRTVGAKKNVMRFNEVFSTALQHMHRANTLRDKQLFMTAIRAIQEANGYY